MGGGMKVVGLMSGTSADGIDAALVNIVRRGGRPVITPIAFSTVPYPRALQQRVVDLSLHGQVAEICHMNAYLGELFAEAALKVIRAAKHQPADIHAIGSHGAEIDQKVGATGIGACHLKRDQDDQGVLKYVVVERAQKLGNEERQEPSPPEQACSCYRSFCFRPPPASCAVS